MVADARRPSRTFVLTRRSSAERYQVEIREEGETPEEREQALVVCVTAGDARECEAIGSAVLDVVRRRGWRWREAP